MTQVLKKLVSIILLASTCQADPAFDAAKEATFIQLGGKDLILSLRRYSRDQIESFGIKEEAKIIGTLFYIVRNKELSCTIDATRLKIKPDRVILELSL